MPGPPFGPSNGSPPHRQRQLCRRESLLPLILAFVHFRRAGEFEDAVIDPAVLTMQPFSAKLPYSTARPRLCCRRVPASGYSRLRDRHQRIPTAILRECLCSTNACRAARNIFFTASSWVSITSYCSRFAATSGQVRFSHHGSVTPRVQFAENTDNTTSTVNIFHMVFWVLGATLHSCGTLRESLSIHSW